LLRYLNCLEVYTIAIPIVVRYRVLGFEESGVRIQESGFRIQDSGFRIQDSGFRS
jgi:hypothetical protein